MSKFLKIYIVMCLSFAPAYVLSAEPPTSGGNDKDINLEAKLSYPELEVTPRASDRLDIEYKYEQRHAWQMNLPIQFSALATLYAATSSEYKVGASVEEKDDYGSAQSLAIGVGAGWLILTGTLAASYRPYRRGRAEIAKMPKGTDREQLTRERISEEALYEPARLATKLKWFSVVSNMAVSALLAKGAHSDSRMAIGVAVTASLAPLIFESRWSRVADQHREYKKKIYGPLAMSTMMPVTESRLAPGVALLWSF